MINRATLVVNLEPRLKNELRRIAADERRSLSAQVTKILEEAVEQRSAEERAA